MTHSSYLGYLYLSSPIRFFLHTHTHKKHLESWNFFEGLPTCHPEVSRWAPAGLRWRAIPKVLCWWFRNLPNQLRLVVYSIIYRVVYIPGRISPYKQFVIYENPCEKWAILRINWCRTWKMVVSKRNLFFRRSMFRFHVRLWEGTRTWNFNMNAKQ